MSNVIRLPYGAQTQQALRLPPLAKLYKGESQDDFKARNGKGYPKDLNYLRVEWSPQLSDNEKRVAQQTWESLYGNQPQEITGLLLVTGDVSSAYEQWARSDKGNPMLLKRCNGESCEYSKTPNTVCQGAEICTSDKQRGCKLVARLQFMLPDFSRLTGLIGSFTLISHSTNDLLNIMAGIQTARALLGNEQLSYRLYRQDTTIVQRDGTPAKKSLVYLNAESQSVIRALNNSMNWDELPSGDETEDLPQLPSGDNEITENAKTPSNFNESGKAWYSDADILGEVAAVLGLSAGKASAKIGKTVTDFASHTELIAAYQQQFGA